MLSEQEIADIFYGMYLYFDTDYPIFKYDFKIPKKLKNHQYKRLVQNSKFEFDYYKDMPRRDVILCSILNNFTCPKLYIGKCKPDKIKNDLKMYKENLMIDIDHVMRIAKLSSDSILAEYKNGKLKWTSFYFMFHFIRFSYYSEALKIELKHLNKIYRIFKFDEEYIKQSLSHIQKKADLISK
jgi:hypothetical protein